MTLSATIRNALNGEPDAKELLVWEFSADKELRSVHVFMSAATALCDGVATPGHRSLLKALSHDLQRLEAEAMYGVRLRV